MTTGEFADLVKKMRDAQRMYFRTRSKTALENSKTLEKMIDNLLEEREKRKSEAKEPTLFYRGET